MGINRLDLGGWRFAFDVFHCRRRYIGIVAPYWCRPAFDGLTIRIDGEKAEWFMLPDSRQFTASIMVKIPFRQMHELKNCWTVEIEKYRLTVDASEEWHGRLALVTMSRFDASYLREWIEHHRQLGVEHFYIYNHEGEPTISKELGYFRDCVTEIPWTGSYHLKSAWQEPFLDHESHCYTQCPQQMHAALKYGHLWDWMGFFDADEFLCPTGDKSIPEILSMAEQHAFGEVPFVRTTALEIKGKWFGTSGRNGEPVGSVLASYTRAERGHTCGTKCFIQPECVTGSVIHYWDADGQTGRVPDNLLRFNHYKAISPFKNRVGKRFDNEYTNEIEDRTILEIGQ